MQGFARHGRRGSSRTSSGDHELGKERRQARGIAPWVSNTVANAAIWIWRLVRSKAGAERRGATAGGREGEVGCIFDEIQNPVGPTECQTMGSTHALDG